MTAFVCRIFYASDYRHTYASPGTPTYTRIRHPTEDTHQRQGVNIKGRPISWEGLFLPILLKYE
jgi:hypothetical protein